MSRACLEGVTWGCRRVISCHLAANFGSALGAARSSRLGSFTGTSIDVRFWVFDAEVLKDITFFPTGKAILSFESREMPGDNGEG